MRKLLRNRAQCGWCNDIIESTYRHDFVTCKCGGLFVDGGHDYARTGGEALEDSINLCEWEETVTKSSKPVSSPDSKTGQFSLRDSGERAKFETGAQRDIETGKPRVADVLEWLPLECLERTADQYIRGAKKYDKDNWKKGIPTSRYLSSAFRHLYMYLIGDRVEDHLAAVVFNVFGIMWNESHEMPRSDTKK